MASQVPLNVIPVSYLHDQKGLRLFELPPELCDIITSGQPVPLTFKSPLETKGRAAEAPLPLAVLCTPDKTYEIKQVQNSNTVLLVRPTQINAEDALSPRVGLEAFATCPSIIELQPFKATAKSVSAVDHLRSLIPPFTSTSVLPLQSLPKNDYFADVPFSRRECDEAWDEIKAFDNLDQAYRPTDALLLSLWRSIRKSLDVTIPANKDEILFTLETDLDFPPGVIEVFVRAMTELRADTNQILFNKEKIINWLNESHLSNVARESGFADDKTILDLWKPLLPEEWLDVHNRELLLQLYRESSMTGPKSASSTGAGAAGGVKRIGKSTNWHEKLKKTRTA